MAEVSLAGGAVFLTLPEAVRLSAEGTGAARFFGLTGKFSSLTSKTKRIEMNTWFRGVLLTLLLGGTPGHTADWSN